MPEFPEVPENLSEISDEELGRLHDELVEGFNAVRESGDVDDATLEEMNNLAESIDALRAEAASRMETAAERQAQLDDLASRVNPAPEEPPVVEEPPEGEPVVVAATPPAEPETTPAPLPVAAAGRPVVGQAPRLASMSQHRPAAMTVREPERPGITITAAGDVAGYSAGQEISGGFRDVAAALIRRHEAFSGGRRSGAYQAVPVATVHANIPEERMLRARNPRENEEKISAVTSPEAITAAGGLCAPLQPYYELQRLGSAARPVRDALATFGADRGGIIVMPPPRWEETSAGVGYVTEAQDTEGGAEGTKPCLTVTCPTPANYEVAAISRCLQFGNFGARAYPELVENWLGNVMTAWAARAERALLDGIATCSTTVTGAKTVGSSRQLVAQIAKAIAYLRSINRMDTDTRLRVLLPAYVLNQAISDLAHGSGYDPGFLREGAAIFTDALGEAGANVSFYLDSGTGDAQVMNGGARETNNSALTNYPGNVVSYIFPEGSFLFLDGGTLDLGVVRDSVLNPTNDYQIFAESWERVACVGVEALRLVSTVVADGTYSPAGTAPGSF